MVGGPVDLPVDRKKPTPPLPEYTYFTVGRPNFLVRSPINHRNDKNTKKNDQNGQKITRMTSNPAWHLTYRSKQAIRKGRWFEYHPRSFLRVRTEASRRRKTAQNWHWVGMAYSARWFGAARVNRWLAREVPCECVRSIIANEWIASL